MLNVVCAILLAVLGVAAVNMLSKYLRLKAAMAIDYGDASQQFFESAAPIVNDGSTPIEVVRLIGFMSNAISEGSTAKLLIRAAAMRTLPNKSVQRLRKVSEEFFTERPELRRSFDEMSEAWFIAVTSLSPIYGRAARVAMSASRASKTVEQQMVYSYAGKDLSKNIADNGMKVA